MAGPRLLVDAPAFTARPYGLLSVVQFPAETSPHWQNGVTWTTNCLESGMGDATWDECVTVTGTGEPPEPPVKDENVERTHRGATPFTVYTRFDCAPVGNEDARQVATDALAQSEPFQLEQAFWTGRIENTEVVFPHLADNAQTLDAQGVVLQTAATQIAGGPHDVADALGRLEDELARCYGGVGVLHVPTRALPTLDAWGLVERRPARDGATGQFGNQLQTRNGNLVAVGAGYPGTSPAGAAPADQTTWLYATGAVFAYRGDVRVNAVRDSLDRSTNTVQMIAERTYTFGWDCCHVAVLTQLGVPPGT